MSMITETAQRAPASDRDCYPTYRMSIEKYEQLVGSGVFTKHDKLQLINGRLVAKMTKQDSGRSRSLRLSVTDKHRSLGK
jgi:hypothetical protein